ncbi:MAG: hypothetical protein ACRDR6_23695 [Pseudonocardiaceae bacterium]
MTKLLTEFQQRLKADDPRLGDFNYTGRRHDAVVIVAPAGERAKSTKGVDISS